MAEDEGLRLPDGKIADFIDGKIRSDTPEEYVRQQIERRLVLELKYKREQTNVEYPVKCGSKKPRVDIAIFEHGKAHTQDNVRILIECKKKESTRPSDRTEGVGQLHSYLAVCPNAQYGMWTNGRQKLTYQVVRNDGIVAFEEINDLPPFGENASVTDKPQREDLMQAAADGLLFAFKHCHDEIYTTDGLQKQPAFFELLKVIFCKIEDERNHPHPLEFFASAAERRSTDGQLAVRNRMEKMFHRVKRKYRKLFEENDSINLKPKSLAGVVAELQRYSFLRSTIDVKGKAYEEIVGANLRGDRGEFFTPRNIQHMAIQMLDVSLGEKLLDPACGTGGFLVVAMTARIHGLREVFRSSPDDDLLRERIEEEAQQTFYGFDINPDLVKATRMNMVMNNDGSGNIFRCDSLVHPHVWDMDFKRQLAESLALDAASLRDPRRDLALFDVIATNPPFGSKLPIKETATLEQFDLGYVWKKEGPSWTRTKEVAESQPPEILFIERCWQLLKPGGRMAIVLPDGILGNPKLGYVRQWILEKFRIIASIDLHPDTFQPRNGTQTSVLILQRKDEDELLREMKQGRLSEYQIFMAILAACGHDKRGNPTYRRDEQGELIWRDVAGVGLMNVDDPNAQVLLVREPIPDDDAPFVAEQFVDWKREEVLGW